MISCLGFPESSADFNLVATWTKGPFHLLLFSFDSVLPQLKGGYAGLAVIERFNRTLRTSIKSFDFQFDLAVPRQPQFKKTISHG
jgi:hypothetical protein